MAQFVFSYMGVPKPSSPEEGAANHQKWQAWLADLGDAVVNPGTPLGQVHVVTKEGAHEAGDDRMTGFSIIEAADLEAALKIAQSCPYLEMGDLQVGQVMTMGG